MPDHRTHFAAAPDPAQDQITPIPHDPENGQAYNALSAGHNDEPPCEPLVAPHNSDNTPHHASQKVSHPAKAPPSNGPAAQPEHPLPPAPEWSVPDPNSEPDVDPKIPAQPLPASAQSAESASTPHISSVCQTSLSPPGKNPDRRHKSQSYSPAGFPAPNTPSSCPLHHPLPEPHANNLSHTADISSAQFLLASFDRNSHKAPHSPQHTPVQCVPAALPLTGSRLQSRSPSPHSALPFPDEGVPSDPHPISRWSQSPYPAHGPRVGGRSNHKKAWTVREGRGLCNHPVPGRVATPGEALYDCRES